MGLKIAVVGGGSTYTPELVEGFITRQDRLPVDELALLDIDRERLEVVGGLAGRILAKRGWPGRLTMTLDREAAIDGADFVVVQLRVGGQAARFLDETLPPRFGYVGQETTGAGGFAKALRTVPVVLELAELVGRRGARAAWIVNFTNPVGIVTQALLDEEHRAVGLCNVAIGFQRRFAAHFGVEPERVQLEHVGLNHLTWVRAIRVNGVDRLPELLDGDVQLLADMVSMPVGLIRALRAVPSYYLHYYYQTRQILSEKRTSRAEDVMAIEQQLLDLYRDPKLAEKLLDDAGHPRGAAKSACCSSRNPCENVGDFSSSVAEPSTAKRRHSSSPRCMPGQATSRSPTSETTAPCLTFPRTRWSRYRRGSIATARRHSPLRPWPQSFAGWSRRPRRTRSSRFRPPRPVTGRSPCEPCWPILSWASTRTPRSFWQNCWRLTGQICRGSSRRASGPDHSAGRSGGSVDGQRGTVSPFPRSSKAGRGGRSGRRRRPGPSGR